MVNDFYSGVGSEYQTPPLEGREEERSVGLIKELSPEEHLRGIILQLQGKVWNSKQKEYVKMEGIKPFMNSDGINAFYQFATAILSPITTFSNYTNKYQLIDKLMLMVMSRATNHFYTHWQNYGFIDESQVTIVLTRLATLGLSAYYKAIGAGDRKAATSNISETINTLLKPDDDSNKKEASGFGGSISRILGRR